jgi:hypothetical protein
MSGLSLAECVERALTEDMARNPVSMLNLTVNHIQKDLLLRQEVAATNILVDEIRSTLTRYHELEGRDRTKLRERMLHLLKKGTKMRNPSEELVALIEEATTLI